MTVETRSLALSLCVLSRIGTCLLIGLAAYAWLGLFATAGLPGRIGLGLVAWSVVSVLFGLFVGRVMALSRNAEVSDQSAGSVRQHEAA